MTNDVHAEVVQLIRQVQRHGAVLSIAMTVDDGLAASVATVRARLVLQRLAALAATDRVIEAGVVAAIERTLADYERLYAAAIIIKTIEDRVRLLRWLEHRSRRDVDLFELDVRDKHLGMLSFAGLELTRCKLVGVASIGARFDGAVLDRCDLSRSDLTRSSWIGARVTRCTFAETSLIDSTLDGARFVDCSFVRADLGASQLREPVTTRETSFVRCDLRGSCWHARELAGTKFEACSFRDVYGRPLVAGVEIEQPDLSEHGDRSRIGSSRDVISAWLLRGAN